MAQFFLFSFATSHMIEFVGNRFFSYFVFYLPILCGRAFKYDYFSHINVFFCTHDSYTTEKNTYETSNYVIPSHFDSE